METLINHIPPVSEKVNIECLVTAFDKRVGSHKFLLFRSILNEIYRSLDNQEGFTGEITYDELRTEMLINAWFPAKFYLLEFGARDSIIEVLGFIKDNVFKEDAEKITTKSEARRLFKKYSKEINKHKKVQAITIWPITRFLSPWFRNELSGLLDRAKDKKIIEASNELFDLNVPMYKILKDEKKIVLHKNWIEYLQKNLNVIEGWLDMHWLRFLQRRNPYVPAISSKLWAPPEKRESLMHLHKFWVPIIDNGFNCIYSNNQISLKNCALDHFVPWSWVGHNQLWNLVPISHELNSSKGAKLPNKLYIPNLAKAHFKLIKFSEKNKPSNWRKTKDDYIAGLHINEEVLNNQEYLTNAYENTISPQLALANNHGFKNWEIKQ